MGDESTNTAEIAQLIADNLDEDAKEEVIEAIRTEMDESNLDDTLAEFGAKHNAIISVDVASPNPHYKYSAKLNLNQSPGKSNIGSFRTDAEEWLSDQGYEIDLQMIESGGRYQDYDALVGFDVINVN